MKKETLEKIRNFLEHLFVLFMSILIMLITFCSLHVHAGFVDSIPDNYNAVNMSAYNSFCLMMVNHLRSILIILIIYLKILLCMFLMMCLLVVIRK